MTHEQENALKKIIKKARLSYEKAENNLKNVYDYIEQLCDIDFQEIETEAENANNVYQAISCFFLYGEYNIDSIVKEIKCAIIESEDKQ